MRGSSNEAALHRLRQLLVEADFGQGDAAAKAALARACDEDAEAKRHAAELDRMWMLLGKLPRPSIEEKVTPFRARAPMMSRARDYFAPLVTQAVAACLAVGIIGGSAWLSLGHAPQTNQPVAIESARGDHRLAQLPDGSTIELSADTKLFVDYSEGQRVVRLVRGEALFTVAHNPERPFIVKAGNGEVRALGTAFDVKLKRDAVVVTVTKGRVQVSASTPQAGRRHAVLGVGQQLTYRETVPSGDILSAPRSIDASNALEWRYGMLEYHGEPLSEVIEEVNRHSTRRIVLLAPEEKNTPIYGILRAGDVEGLASIIRDRGTSEKNPAPVVRIDPADAN